MGGRGEDEEVHVEGLGLFGQGHTSPEASTNSGHKLLIQILDVAERYLLKLYHLSARNSLLKVMKMPAHKINIINNVSRQCGGH